MNTFDLSFLKEKSKYAGGHQTEFHEQSQSESERENFDINVEI